MANGQAGGPVSTDRIPSASKVAWRTSQGMLSPLLSHHKYSENMRRPDLCWTQPPMSNLVATAGWQRQTCHWSGRSQHLAAQVAHGASCALTSASLTGHHAHGVSGWSPASWMSLRPLKAASRVPFSPKDLGRASPLGAVTKYGPNLDYQKVKRSKGRL